jgi:trans-2,3-dihydro-3-hydroxyanthranilate isomerase
MTDLIFYLVDVFAEEKYAGNQLAVIRHASSLSTIQMQQIANEMHFSETSFILSDIQRNGGYDVRIFTPATELPFAGHPTLGTAYVIKRFLSEQSVSEVKLNLKVGQIPVKFDQEVVWMKQKPPVFGKTFEVPSLADVLRLKIDDVNIKYPIQEVSTGLPFIIVPLNTLDAVRRARVNVDAFQKKLPNTQAGILVFCPQTYHKSNNLNVRVFVDAFGIPEDPATGAGNGCLAGYLSRYRYFGDDKVDVRVEQGYEVNRPSLILIKADNIEGETAVQVGGRVVLVAEGRLLA